jgi:protein TonB
MFIASQFVVYGQTSTKCDFPPYINDKEIYDIVEYQPKYPGGTNELNKFIEDNFVNPNPDDTTLSSVVVKFIVDENGNCVHPCVMAGGKEIPQDIYDAAIDLFDKMPNWEPGKHRGKNENVFAFIRIEL